MDLLIYKNILVFIWKQKFFCCKVYSLFIQNLKLTGNQLKIYFLVRNKMVAIFWQSSNLFAYFCLARNYPRVKINRNNIPVQYLFFNCSKNSFYWFCITIYIEKARNFFFWHNAEKHYIFPCIIYRSIWSVVRHTHVNNGQN